MRLVFAGTPDVALPSLDALLTAPRHEVVAVVTRPDAPAGRGRRLAASPVKQRAVEAGIDVLQPRRPSDDEFLQRLVELAPECCPVVAYGALVPRPALAIPEHGWVNLHFSLLPSWRGAAPVQHAILAGDDVTGASTFRLEEGLDTGPVYGVVTTTVGARETAGELLARLAVDGAQLLLATLDGIESGQVQPRPQPGEGVTLAPKVTPEHARIDWAAPGARVDRLVRACTPEPGAWTTFRGVRLGIGPVVVGDGGPTDLAPGTLRERGRAGVDVGVGDGVVRLGEVQPQGRRPMPAADWARGARLSDADRLE